MLLLKIAVSAECVAIERNRAIRSEVIAISVFDLMTLIEQMRYLLRSALR